MDEGESRLWKEYQRGRREEILAEARAEIVDEEERGR